MNEISVLVRRNSRTGRGCESSGRALALQAWGGSEYSLSQGEKRHERAYNEKKFIHTPGKVSSPNTRSAGPLILDFQPPELQEDKLPLLKTSSPVVHWCDRLSQAMQMSIAEVASWGWNGLQTCSFLYSLKREVCLILRPCLPSLSACAYLVSCSVGCSLPWICQLTMSLLCPFCRVPLGTPH
jgi:hypothetical protein